jgi:hypothetical protein
MSKELFHLQLCRSEFLPSVDNALEEGEIMDEPTEKTKMFRFYTRHAAIKDNQKAIISFSKVIQI